MLMALIGWLAAGAIPDLDTPPQRAVAEQPLVELFSYEDYPADALLQGAEGQVSVRLLVGADGRAEDCEVTESAGNDSLDQVTCSILRERSRFAPARDARDRAVRDVISTRVRWQIETERIAFAETLAVVDFRHEAGATQCVLHSGEARTDMPVSYCLATFGPFAGLVAQPDVAGLRFETRILPVGVVAETRAIGVGAETLWDYAGEIAVAPNGTVSRCETSRSAPGPHVIAELGDAFTPCTALRDQPFEEQGRELRRASVEGAYLVIRRPRR